MEVACGEHGDWTYKLKKAVECMDDLDDDSSVGDESTYEGKQDMALQASTLCLLQEKVDKRATVNVRTWRFVGISKCRAIIW